MVKRKGYQISPEMAAELERVSEELSIPENAVINFALRQFLIDYRKGEEILCLRGGLKQSREFISAA